MEINHIIGDATNPKEEVQGLKILIHIVNNRNKWGAGFSGALSKRWGTPELIYRKQGSDNLEKLKNSLGEVQIMPVEKNIWVVNMIAQDGIGKQNGKPPIRYEALSQCLEKVQEFADKQYKKIPSIHAPRIGAGLAGGSWEKIEKIILDKISIPVYIYTLPNEAKKYGLKENGDTEKNTFT